MTSLEQALAERRADPVEGTPGTEGGLYLQPFAAELPRFTVDEELTLDIRPMYRGRNQDGSEHIDRRVMLVLMDNRHRHWPVLIHLGRSDAEALLAKLAEEGEER